MLLQQRRDELWLIQQHDHGWHSGEIAHAWRGVGESPVYLPHALCLATTLHDLAWATHDQTPLLDASSGLPTDFLHIPLAERLPLYKAGIDDLEAVHPHVALLVSMHYSAFKGLRGVEAYQAHEEARQARLRRQLGFVDAEPQGSDDAAMLQRQLRFVQLFDLLSLYICLTAPGVDPAQRPPWLLPDDVARSPDGDVVSLAWIDETTLRCSPMPLSGDLALTLPVRKLPETRYPDQATLLTAWSEADTTLWKVHVVG